MSVMIFHIDEGPLEVSLSITSPAMLWKSSTHRPPNGLWTLTSRISCQTHHTSFDAQPRTSVALVHSANQVSESKLTARARLHLLQPPLWMKCSQQLFSSRGKRLEMV